jgi:copper chaperone
MHMSATTHVVLNVPSVSCNHCKMAIEGAVGRLKGVVAVAVTVEDKSVDVRFDADQIGLSAIEQVIADEGYEVVGEHAFES